MLVMWEDLTSTPGYNAELGKSRDTVVRVNAEWYISEHLKVIALFDKHKVSCILPHCVYYFTPTGKCCIFALGTKPHYMHLSFLNSAV